MKEEPMLVAYARFLEAWYDMWMTIATILFDWAVEHKHEAQQVIWEWYESLQH